jgi:hypothetical protein
VVVQLQAGIPGRHTDEPRLRLQLGQRHLESRWIGECELIFDLDRFPSKLAGWLVDR